MEMECRCIAELTDTFIFVVRHRDLLESFALMFEMEIRLYFIEWSDTAPSTTAVSAVAWFDGCYFPLFKMR